MPVRMNEVAVIVPAAGQGTRLGGRRKTIPITRWKTSFD